MFSTVCLHFSGGQKSSCFNKRVNDNPLCLYSLTVLQCFLSSLQAVGSVFNVKIILYYCISNFRLVRIFSLWIPFWYGPNGWEIRPCKLILRLIVVYALEGGKLTSSYSYLHSSLYIEETGQYMNRRVWAASSFPSTDRLLCQGQYGHHNRAWANTPYTMDKPKKQKNTMDNDQRPSLDLKHMLSFFVMFPAAVNDSLPFLWEFLVLWLLWNTKYDSMCACCCVMQ